MGYNFNPQTPQQQSNNYTPRESNVDFDALFEYQLAKLGGEGKHDFIGVISRLDELGVQEQDVQTIPWDDKAKAEHAWRFEKGDDGSVKDPSAKVVTTKYAGKEQECLVYSRKPVAQVAISVDFPEVMMNLSQFYNPEYTGQKEKPFREIIGLNGFLPEFKRGKGAVIAKPFNLNHINVNRQKKDAKPHYAIAKNSLLYSMAEWVGALDDEGNFHNTDLGKLIGEPMNFEVEVKVNKWNSNGKENKRLEVSITPTSKLSVRDRKAYDEELSQVVTDDLFGVLMFSGGNTEQSLKEVRKATVNTMKMSSNWETSKLKEELEKVNPNVLGVQSESSQTSNASKAEQSYSEENKPAEKAPAKENKPVVEDVPDLDFSDDIPFAPIALQYRKLLHVM